MKPSFEQDLMGSFYDLCLQCPASISLSSPSQPRHLETIGISFIEAVQDPLSGAAYAAAEMSSIKDVPSLKRCGTSVSRTRVEGQVEAEQNIATHLLSFI